MLKAPQSLLKGFSGEEVKLAVILQLEKMKVSTPERNRYITEVSPSGSSAHTNACVWWGGGGGGGAGRVSSIFEGKMKTTSSRLKFSHQQQLVWLHVSTLSVIIPPQ